MAKVKVGVIGVGVMGDHHARIYSTLKEASLVGIFDYNQERAKEVAEKYKTKSFESVEALLSEVSAVSIVSPTKTHYEVAKLCLNSGKHILCEKPLASTFEEGEEIVKLAKEKGLVFAVGMIERFNPAFQKTLSLVRHEKILGTAFKRYSPYPQRISDASVVFDMMFHDLDLALALSEAEVSSIKAAGKKISSKMLDEVTATLYFKDGMISKIEASRVHKDKVRHLTITTDKYIYEVDLLNKKAARRNFDNLTEKENLEVKEQDQLTEELKDFLNAVEKNKAPKVTGEKALVTLKIAEEVEKIA